MTVQKAHRFHLELDGKEKRFTDHAWQRLLKKAREHWHNYRKTGNQAFLAFFKRNPFAFLTWLVAKHFSQATGVSLKVKSELPFGCGLGSSAALAAATIASLWRARGKKVFKRRLFEAVQEAEVCHHGTPSGADAYAVIYGGLFQFQKSPFQVQKLGVAFPFHAALVVTGKPVDSTAEVVAFVREQPKRKAAFQQMTQALGEILEGIREKDFHVFRTGLQTAHRALQKIQVTTSLSDAIVEKLWKKGLAAKQCGAGTVHGKAAGCILVCAPEQEPLSKALSETSLPSFLVRLGGKGLRSS